MACGSQREVEDQFVQALKEQLAQRFEGAIAELAANIQRTEDKVETVIAPMLQSLSLANTDTKRDIARLDAAILETQYGEDMLLSTVGDAVAGVNADLKKLQSQVSGAMARLDSFGGADATTTARQSGGAGATIKARLKSLEMQVEDFVVQQSGGAGATTVARQSGGASATVTARLTSLEMQIADFAARQSGGATTAVRLESLEMQMEDFASWQSWPAPVRQECASQTQGLGKEVVSQATHVATPSNAGVPACVLDLAQLGVHERAFAQDACAFSSGIDGCDLSPFEQALLGRGGKRPVVPAKHAQGRGLEKELGGKPGTTRSHKGEKSHGAEWSDPLSPPFARAAGAMTGFRMLERPPGARSPAYLPPMF